MEKGCKSAFVDSWCSLQLGDAPSGHKTAVAEGSGAKDDADQDLMARLEALRKS